jgi:membrane fusion protein, copper/silver efflux system
MNLNAMTPKHWLLAIVVFILLAGAGGYWFANYRSHDMPAAAASSERKVLYWHDPMVPNVRFDKPGKSPFMDMQLVPVYADEAGTDSGVRVAANVTQSLGVRIGKVEKTTAQRKLTVVGSLVFNDQLVEVVPARVEGYVTRLFVRAPLEKVRRGQPLAEIQAPAWLEAQQEYLSLLDAQSESGRSLQAAARKRLHVLGVPEATIRRIETQRKTAASTTLTSPIDGVVSELGVREGAGFMPGAPLFRINGLETVWVNARVPEAQLSLVALGSEVTATATAWPGVAFKGKVIALLPQVDADTRTLTARIVLDNKDGKLSPGMFVSLDLMAPESQAQLVVPSEAVITTGTRSIVITARDNGTFGVVEVSVGAEQDGKTAILSGLTEGQSIVLSGQFLIDSEASLKSAVSRLDTPALPTAAEPMKMETAPGSHTAEGTISEIGADSITLDHGAVASLNWPPMTMGFELPSAGIAKGLKAGDRVRFTFTRVEGGYRIDTISRIDDKAMPKEHAP